MKIRRLMLRAFGGLRGEWHFSADRVNLVLEPNEGGKSTLSTAILAALYGFPPGQRRSEGRPIPDVDVYRPWSGEEYVVEMDVEAAGRAFTIRRDFTKKDERVYEWRSGKDISAEFQRAKDALDFGALVTGLDREDFSRTVFLRQTELGAIRGASGITAALQKMATSQQGDVAAAEAIETLGSALKQYRGRKIRRGKVDSEITEIDKEIEALSDRLRGMDERRAEAEKRIRELEDVSGKEGRVDDQLQKLEYLVMAAGRREDAARLDQETREKEDLQALEAEFQSLAPWAEVPADGLQRIIELREKVRARREEARRAGEKAETEIEKPIAEMLERVRASEAMSSLGPAALAKFSSAESALLADWRAEREARRSLRALARRHSGGGLDTGRLKALAEKFAALRPENRRFLMTYGEDEMGVRSAVADLEREVERKDTEIAALEKKLSRARDAGTFLTFAFALGLGAAVALWFFTSWPRYWAVAAAAAAIGSLLARVALAPAEGAQARLGTLRSERDTARTTAAEKSADLDAIHARLEILARQAGHESGDALLEEFREAETNVEESAELSALLRHRDEAAHGVRATGRRIAEMMEQGGHRPRFGAVTPGTARAFRALAASHRETLTRLEEMKDRRAGAERDQARIEEEIGRILSEGRALLRSARLDPDMDLETAAAEYEKIAQKRERYESLKRETIPALVRRAMSHQGDPLRRAVEVADAVLRRKTQENASLSALAPERSHKEYVEERDRLRMESRSLAERRLHLSAELGEVLREYRKEYPDTQRWLEEWTDVKRRTESFRAAVTLACDVLDGISREAYAEWADVLNERASEALSHIARGYTDLRFEQDLGVSVRDGAGGSRRAREEVDHRLSSGTRDQIYFAARLALADYLSSGRLRLPLILDDPFGSFDEERFASAMELLVDKFSRRHQIVILSCHETRYRVWQERNPERFADRVRMMSLQAPAT